MKGSFVAKNSKAFVSVAFPFKFPARVSEEKFAGYFKIMAIFWHAQLINGQLLLLQPASEFICLFACCRQAWSFQMNSYMPKV